MRSLVIALAILTTIGFADTLLLEDFNSAWSTNSPPAGWRIFHTDTTVQGSDDWHRNDSASLPWTTNLSPYAAIYYNLAADPTPDSLISPIIDCSGFGNVTLTCNTYFERKFPNPYDAYLVYSVDSGLTFSVLRDYYELSVGPAVETLELTHARNQPGVVIAWMFDGSLGDIDWWCVDDVLLEADTIPVWDIGCSRILAPAGQIQPGAMTPIARFTNWGLNDQDSIPVYCTLYDSSGASLQTWADTLYDTLYAGDWDTLSFTPAYTFATGADSYYIEFWCAADSDDNRANDTLGRYFDVTTLEQYRYDDNSVGDYLDWPVGHNGWGVRFSPSTYPVALETLMVYLRFPASAIPDHRRFQLAVLAANNDGTPGQAYSKTPVLTGSDGWNRVFVADTGEHIVIDTGDFYVFYLQVGEPPQCPELAVDNALGAPDSTFWEYRSGSYLPFSPTGDIKIRVTANTEIPLQPLRDMRALYLEDPLYEFVQRPFDAPVTPRARVGNIGTLTLENVPVLCSIYDPSDSLIYDDDQIIRTISSGTDTTIVFADWTPVISQRCSVVIRTVSVTATPDLVPQNDEKRFTVDIRRGRYTGGTGIPGDYAWIDSDTTDGPVFDWVDTADADIVIAQGSEIYMFVPIWFYFPYFDSSYNNVIVSTNGWLSLGASQGVTESLPRPVPNTNPPNRALYPWWDNHANGLGYGGGRVYYKSEGVAPNRRFIVTWQDVNREGSDTADLISFQAILNENGTIVYQYKDVTTGDLEYDNARYATIGAENDDGTDGLCYLYARPPMDDAVNDLENRVTAGRAVRFYKIYTDAAALNIVKPASYVFEGPIIPEVTVQNYGTVRDTIRAFLQISGTPPYVDSVVIPDLGPGDSTTVAMPSAWNAVLGEYSARCSVAMNGDADSTNNVFSRIVIVSPWIQRPDIPEGARRKVKSGTLVYSPGENRLYAMKGSVDNTFWYFDVATGAWDTLAPMPLPPTGKKAKDGVDLAFDPDHGTRGTIWAIKGGGRTDFYAYDIDSNTWTEKKSVFISYLPGYRPPKKGARIEYVPSYGSMGAVYCIPGNNTRFLWRYNIASDSWQNTEHDVPIDPIGRYRRCKHGSDLAYGDGLLYCLKGSNTLECYAYNPLAESAHLAWVDTIDQVSLFGPRRRKVKSGGSMTYKDSTLYVLKGGNTQEFWSYYVGTDTWHQRTDIPMSLTGRRRKVKRGSALAAADSTIYALKGSYGYEFWEYKPAGDTSITPYATGRPERDGVMASVDDLRGITLGTYPNPTRAGLTIRFSLARPSMTSVRIYDPAGKLVRTLYDAAALPGEHSLRWDGLGTRRRRVPAGVYFVQLESGGASLTRKLIIQR